MTLRMDFFCVTLVQNDKTLKPLRFQGFFMVDDTGFEPVTFRTSSGCSSQLS